MPNNLMDNSTAKRQSRPSSFYLFGRLLSAMFERVVSGQNWAGNINDALKMANTVIAIISKNSVRRSEVLREISEALSRSEKDEDFRVIFVVIGSVHPSWFVSNDKAIVDKLIDYLKTVQYVQLDARGTINIACMQNLLRALNGKMVYSDGIEFSKSDDYIYEAGMPEKVYDNDAENCFYRVHSSDLAPSTAFPFALDNQWLPDEVISSESELRSSFLKHGFESENVQKYLEKFQTKNLYLSLMHGMDISTGEKGYNLAAIMLLGKDHIILNACPAYETDALVRKVNVDRYDDREIIRTNLIESFDLLMEFARKHLLDKFFLENEVNVSLRNILAREMISNTLMHREFTSTYAAKFVIEKDRMYVENASRASKQGIITPENLEPNPKNPIISSFFRNIGRADRLGSGVRNLYKYSKYYSGAEPTFMEGDVFRIIVPLNDAYSFDFGQNGRSNQSNQSNQTGLTEEEQKLLNWIKLNPDMTNTLIAESLDWSVSKVKYYVQKLKRANKIKRAGTSRKGYWEVFEEEDN